jgi:hypothetical protein
MHALLLSGHRISMRVENAHLTIRDGYEFEQLELFPQSHLNQVEHSELYPNPFFPIDFRTTPNKLEVATTD